MFSRDIIVVKEDIKYKVLLLYSTIIFVSAFFFNTPSEIFLGMKNIVTSPSLLLTDYIEVI